MFSFASPQPPTSQHASSSNVCNPFNAIAWHLGYGLTAPSTDGDVHSTSTVFPRLTPTSAAQIPPSSHTNQSVYSQGTSPMSVKTAVVGHREQVDTVQRVAAEKVSPHSLSVIDDAESLCGLCAVARSQDNSHCSVCHVAITSNGPMASTLHLLQCHRTDNPVDSLNVKPKPTCVRTAHPGGCITRWQT